MVGSKYFAFMSHVYRLSMYEISAVTLLIGLSTPLSPQLTRRIIQVVIHSQYNAVTYVSCLNV
jgi:hypothetical protein